MENATATTILWKHYERWAQKAIEHSERRFGIDLVNMFSDKAFSCYKKGMTPEKAVIYLADT